MKIIIALTLLLYSSLTAKELTLLCIGDSLIEGSKTHSTYRHSIDKYTNQKLVHTGPFQDQKSLRHVGRGGWSVQRMAPKFKSWYTQYPKDIIILMTITIILPSKNLFPSSLKLRKASSDK